MALSRRAESPVSQDPRGGVRSRSGLVRLTSNSRARGLSPCTELNQFPTLFVQRSWGEGTNCRLPGWTAARRAAARASRRQAVNGAAVDGLQPLCR